LDIPATSGPFWDEEEGEEEEEEEEAAAASVEQITQRSVSNRSSLHRCSIVQFI